MSVPRLQQSKYQKREVGGIWIQSVWWVYTQLVPKPCTKDTPENPPFKDRYARVYCGLSTEEALWLVSRHNIRAAMYHVISLWYW